MEGCNVYSIDWLNVISGAVLRMRDFPSVRLMKLDNSKACYFDYSGEPKIVDIREHFSDEHGSYYYFQTRLDDWHPLTNRLGP